MTSRPLSCRKVWYWESTWYCIFIWSIDPEYTRITVFWWYFIAVLRCLSKTLPQRNRGVIRRSIIVLLSLHHLSEPLACATHCIRGVSHFHGWTQWINHFLPKIEVALNFSQTTVVSHCRQGWQPLTRTPPRQPTPLVSSQVLHVVSSRIRALYNPKILLSVIFIQEYPPHQSSHLDFVVIVTWLSSSHNHLLRAAEHLLSRTDTWTSTFCLQIQLQSDNSA
jgi:hypothetical protein